MPLYRTKVNLIFNVHLCWIIVSKCIILQRILKTMDGRLTTNLALSHYLFLLKTAFRIDI